MSTLAVSKTHIPFDINETDTLAGTTKELVAPIDGYISDLYVIVQKDVTTGGAVTVKKVTTDVNGLSVTVANAATKGTVYSDTSTVGHSSRKVAKGERIQIVPDAAFATAGAIAGFISIAVLDA